MIKKQTTTLWSKEIAMSRGIYWHAPEVEKIIHDLVETKCIFPDLLGVPITALFTEKTMKSKGQLILAKIKKCSEFELALVETMLEKDSSASPDSVPDPPPAYIMIVSNDAWLDLGIIEVDRVGKVDQAEALVFHELSHCHVKVNEDDGIASYGTKDHDYTGFYAEAVKYGTWLDTYKDTVKAFNGEMPVEESEESKESKES